MEEKLMGGCGVCYWGGRRRGGGGSLTDSRQRVHHRHVNVAHHFPLVLHLHTEQNATCAEDHGFHQILIEQALRRTDRRKRHYPERQQKRERKVAGVGVGVSL